MKIEIVCPLYNCENTILQLNKSINVQNTKYDYNITYIFTESTDNTEQILINNNIEYNKIRKNEFSHSLTREKYARLSDSDIICFISQDIEITNNNWLNELVNPLISNEADATFSRQISKYKNIEKYTREFNYPNESYYRTKKDVEKYGLKTFFFSDASSAIKKDIFEKLNYYDGKDFPTNEDMYIAYKLIMNGYKIKYCSSSVVYHSHNYKLKDVFNRYKETGKFFKMNQYFDNYKINGSGIEMAKYIFVSALKNCDMCSLIRYPFDMMARYFGMMSGKNNE